MNSGMGGRKGKGEREREVYIPSRILLGPISWIRISFT
jgi:hypothetical protein